MILKTLTIENFGKIRHFETSFHRQLTEISDDNADDIIKVIGLVTGNKSLSGCAANNAITENTYINMGLEINDHPYMITAKGQPHENQCDYKLVDRKNDLVVDSSSIHSAVRLCEEEESLVCYRYDSKGGYAEHFLHYKDPDKYYQSGDFQKRTNGLGRTRSFRACLAEYIKDYEMSNFPSDGYKIKLCPDGEFICCSEDDFSPSAETTERNKRIFDYKCYLAVVDFWDCFENIRDMNHEKWPLIVDSTKNHDYLELEKFLDKTKSERQMIIMKSNDQKRGSLI